MRLDKYLAHAAGLSRTEAKKNIKSGRVCVDGITQTEPEFSLSMNASVSMNGETLKTPEHLYIMLHKPAGVITAAEDSHTPTVMDLLPPVCQKNGCMPVGRLDKDTEGLLLFTTDGRLAHRLLAPQRKVPKTYFVQTEQPLSAFDREAFERGIQTERFSALPAQLQILSENTAHVTVREGQFHQIKRMFAARKNTVLYLKRISFGSLRLDEALPSGAYRPLTREEIISLYQDAGWDEVNV